jgi:hypothetical protein
VARGGHLSDAVAAAAAAGETAERSIYVSLHAGLSALTYRYIAAGGPHHFLNIRYEQISREEHDLHGGF